MIHFIVENRRDDFGALEKLYDPSGEFRRKYLDEQMHFRLHREEGGSAAVEEKSPASESEATTEEAAAAAQDHGQSAEGRR